MALLRGGGHLRHPGTSTCSQSLDECNSHDWQIIATKLWICGMQAPPCIQYLDTVHYSRTKGICEITFDDINFVKHHLFFCRGLKMEISTGYYQVRCVENQIKFYNLKEKHNS